MNKLLAKLYSVQLPDMNFYPVVDDHGSVMAEDHEIITELAFKVRWRDVLQLGDPAKLIESHQWFEIRPSIKNEIIIGRDIKFSISMSREIAECLVAGAGDDRSVLMDEIISALEEVVRMPRLED